MCSIKQMEECFPIGFLNYLNEFLRYLSFNLKEDIEKYEAKIKHHSMKMQAYTAVKQTINIRNKIEEMRRPIVFALSEEDTLVKK